MHSTKTAICALGELMPGKCLGSLLCIMFSLIFVFSSVFAAPGDLDSAFGIGGKVVTNPTTYSTLLGYSVGLQPDGKIVAVGNAYDLNSSIFYVARFNPDGTYDTTFGIGGWAAFPGKGRSVAIQPDGKIVVAGATNGTGRIFRFTAAGAWDTSFDGDGIAVISGGVSNFNDSLTAVDVAPDGKIVFGGSTSASGSVSYTSFVGRINADGSPDSTFASSAYITTGPGVVEDITVLQDGSIFAAGGGEMQQTWGTYFSVKFNSNGTVGWSNSGFGSLGARYYGVAAQSDGKVIIVGGSPNDLIMKRFLADGTVDSTFVSPTVNGTGRSVAVQPDGKIVVAFALPVPQQGTRWRVLRCSSDGSIDQGFGSNGVASTEIGVSAFPADVMIQPDGKILSLGWTFIGGGYSLAMARYVGGNAAPIRSLFDFDGDGKSDISVYRSSTGEWYILNSGNSTVSVRQFGLTFDAPVPADFDGDGITDIAIRRPSSEPSGGWWYSLSGSGGAVGQYPYVPDGDFARPGDFNVDGRADIVTFSSTTNVWTRYDFVTGQNSDVTFGSAGDKPLLGDFDGDGKSDVAIYRPSSGEWWWQSSVDNVQRATHWGISSDIPAPADFDGDGKTDFAVYRPADGVWYVYQSSNGSPVIFAFGIAEDKPVPADYDGDGRADIAVYRPSTGIWYLLRSTAGFGTARWGIATDIPTQNAYTP